MYKDYLIHNDSAISYSSTMSNSIISVYFNCYSTRGKICIAKLVVSNNRIHKKSNCLIITNKDNKDNAVAAAAVLLLLMMMTNTMAMRMAATIKIMIMTTMITNKRIFRVMLWYHIWNLNKINIPWYDICILPLHNIYPYNYETGLWMLQGKYWYWNIKLNPMLVRYVYYS